MSESIAQGWLREASQNYNRDYLSYPSYFSVDTVRGMTNQLYQPVQTPRHTMYTNQAGLRLMEEAIDNEIRRRASGRRMQGITIPQVRSNEPTILEQLNREYGRS